MALSGDGGDEIFAGYRYYGKILRKHSKPVGAIPRLRKFLFDVIGIPGLHPPFTSPRGTWYRRAAYIGEELREKLWHPEYRYLMEQSRAWNDKQFEPVKDADLLSQCQYVDIHNYLPYNNLYKVDIASMCHGLEVRVPLLDHVLLELVATIPPEMKLRAIHGSSQRLQKPPNGPFISKYVFKRTAERFFRPDFLNRKKHGFSVPITVWFAGPYHRELRRRLVKSSGRLGELFDLRFVQELVDKHLTERGQGLRLWTLLFLAEWMEQNSYSIK
jgi:asparagine synthase (glutamine-hydrolysing)